MNYIKGVGVDITKISRFTGIISKYESNFIYKVLHNNEIDEYKKLLTLENKSQYLASRWSFKEALVKATWNKSIIFTKTFLVKNENGKPFANFDENYKSVVNINEKKLHVSLSHDNDTAIAFVIYEV